MMRPLLGSPSACAAVLAMACSSAAVAQPVQSAEHQDDVAPTSADEAQSGGQVEELVVTAQRREQNLQRVPIAVSAFSANTLESLRVDNSTELLKFVPNVISFNNGGQAAQANYYFRGIGTPEGIQTFDPPVLTYVDEVPLGRIGSANIQFLDVDRVEVLRGPQGTLFGRNVTGGAVAYYTRKPADDFRINAVGRYGERNHIEGRVSIDVPLSSRVFTQASAFFQKEDGYISSAFSGEDGYGGLKNWGGRVALRFEATDRFSVNLAADFSKQQRTSLTVPGNGASPRGLRNDEGGTLFRTFRLNNLILTPCTKGKDPLDWTLNNCTASVAVNQGVTANLRLDLGDAAQLNFITALRRAKQRYSLDFGGNNPSSANPEFILSNDSTFDQLSQEVKLTGGAFGDRLNYVAGLFYYDEDDRTRVDEFGRARGGPRVQNQIRQLKNKTKSLAAYIQTDLEVATNLTLTTGLRYTRDRKKVDVNLSRPNGTLIYDTGQISGDPKINSRRFTPRVSVQYQATPDIMFYGSYTNGFKSGGWNGRSNTAVAFNSFGDEKVNSYEIGTRTRLIGGRLRLNVTAFHAEYKDLQINTALLLPNNTTIFITDNAGDSRVKGVELESNFVLTSEISGHFAMGIQDGKFTRLDRGTIAAGLTLDSPLPQTPGETYSGGITYSQDFAELGGPITFTAGAQYVPAYNPGVTANSIKTRDLIFSNATLAYAPLGTGIEIAVECRNCFRNVQNIYPNLTGSALLGVLPYVGARIGFKI